MYHKWFLVITGCNKYEPQVLGLRSHDELQETVEALGGDWHLELKDLYEGADDNELDALPLFCDLETYNDDLPYNLEYLCFKIDADPEHVCFIENEYGRRLYCVKKKKSSNKKILEWVTKTII